MPLPLEVHYRSMFILDVLGEKWFSSLFIEWHGKLCKLYSFEEKSLKHDEYVLNTDYKINRKDWIYIKHYMKTP